MKTAKSWFGLVGALIPILFFGGLFLYFTSVNNASYGLLDGALGPTRIGLGALTILFALLFLWRLKTAATPPPPRAGLSATDGAIEEPKSDFDADAAMARYLARRGAGTAVPPGAPSGAPASFGGETPPRPPAGSFGRKGTFQ
ncbi:MAG TPA: hypothetical protein VEC11_06175 [Allosphingosinicella sp.]|nr:hypothetical protein [Allosphingosinicella sp.]